ncbi:MAG: S41 family peptidase [Candidatus Nealsonbacteria bacterium]|nr:S41 family peptidase [Candidatus Nealsonbacteria bacterium]
MAHSIRKFLLVIFFVLILSLVFGIGFYFGKSQIPVTAPDGILNEDFGKPERLDFSLFWEAWRKLEEKYVDSSEIDYKKMLYGAISGLTASLKDDYTLFFPPAETKIFKEDVSGEFQGVGMEIGIKDRVLTIIAPLEGTPAERAGLKPGDKIIKIDGKNTTGMSTEEAVKLIRGPKGKEVNLTILRDGWDEVKDFKIIRDVIEVPSLKLEIKDGPEIGYPIAYIKLYQFSEAARYAFNKASLEILRSPSQKIILDLRNNPGGYLEVAQDIAGWFLKEGQIVTIEDFGGKEPNEEYKAGGPADLFSYPVVVLINKGSASASEILAGALRDNRGIKLIGEKSFGKGSVQELLELKEGSLKVTVARWLTPNGSAINGEGLIPDIEVKMTDEDFEKKLDPQLDKAIEVIKEIR